MEMYLVRVYKAQYFELIVMEPIGIFTSLEEAIEIGVNKHITGLNKYMRRNIPKVTRTDLMSEGDHFKIDRRAYNTGAWYDITPMKVNILIGQC